MMHSNEEIESFPSDFLTTDEQEELFSDVGHEMVDLFDPDATSQLGSDENSYLPEDFKPVFPTISHQLPVAPNNVLSNEEYSGPYEFEVSVIPNNGTKNPWVYSPIINKIFMDMNINFPVDFKIKNRPPGNLYIRITPQYSSPQYSQEPVYRCIQHEHANQPSNNDILEHVRQHVIRCHNPQALYVGEKVKNDRLSICIPFLFPQTGVDSVREIFAFVCKNSCPTPGMNRRPLEIIFTLENEHYDVLGRKSLSVRICSCPKRDKEKEEKEFNSKSTNPLPRGKKRKMDKSEKKFSSTDSDVKEIELNLKIVGKDNAQQVLKYCADLISGDILRYANNPKVAAFKKCLEQINLMRNDFTG